MKQLSPITVGARTFEVSAEHFPIERAFVTVTVKCGEDSLTGKMNLQCPHDHPEEQFEKDVNDFAALLAVELAGKIRSQELARKFSQG